MKFVLILMMSVLIVVTHQYFPDQQIREMPYWLSPYLPQPYMMGRKYQPFLDRYYSAPIRPIYSSLELPWENSQGNAHFAYAENTDSAGENLRIIPNHLADVESRAKVSLRLPEQLSARFFFGTSATITNPFLKTATFTVSSTVTATVGVKCIPAAEFVAVANQKVPCRRKRGFLIQSSLGQIEEEDFIAPSEPQTMLMATALPSLRSDSAVDRESALLDSSKSDDVSASAPSGENFNEKRFIFFTNRNAFVVSTTVTTFKFVSVTSTLTIDIVLAANNLNCLPTGYVVC